VAANSKFIRRLRREITSSPKKAAVLGLSLVVAIWFWAPLIASWTGAKSSGDETPTAPLGSEAAMANSTAVARASAAKTTTPNWHQVLEWMRNDTLMKPYTASAQQRDPFAPAASQLAKRAESQQPIAEPPELSPEQAGLALRSTVVGPRAKTALINGRAYHEQQSVVAANGRDRFVLVEIRPSSIVLQRHGRSFELRLPRVEATSTEE
jgi:hypothetical protein